MTHFCHDHGSPAQEDEAEGELGLERGHWGWKLLSAAFALAVYAGILAGLFYGQMIGAIVPPTQ